MSSDISDTRFLSIRVKNSDPNGKKWNKSSLFLFLQERIPGSPCWSRVYSGVISEGFFLSYVCWVGGLNLDFWDVLCSLVPKSFLSFLIYKQKPWSLSRDEESFGYMYTFSHTHTHTLKFLEKKICRCFPSLLVQVEQNIKIPTF